MEEINKTGVTNMEELRNARAGMRLRVAEKEKELIDHVKPVVRILSLFRRNKKTKKDQEGETSFVSKAAKILMPLIVGRQVMKNKKKLLLFPLLGYALKQGAEYVFSKPASEHIDDFREKFVKKEKNNPGFL